MAYVAETRCSGCGYEITGTSYECMGVVLCPKCWRKGEFDLMAELLQERGYMDEDGKPTQKAVDNFDRMYDDEGRLRPGSWCDG
jgi:hypothetical protein